MSTGVYTTKKKNGSIYYRVSITFRGKHISLGSFDDEETAYEAYLEGRKIVDSSVLTLTDYDPNMKLAFHKYIVLINFRDNGLYVANPIYLRKQYFEYFLSPSRTLKFDRDDLFFFASHKIQQRGGYLFVCDYGSQYKILSRYGIRPFAVYGRDYIMVNGDKDDFRYSNIKIVNNYTGVSLKEHNGQKAYRAIIHINGNYIIGDYSTAEEAAIAYNKAVDTLHANGFNTSYIKNYITSLKKEEYLNIYYSLSISSKLCLLTPKSGQ